MLKSTDFEICGATEKFLEKKKMDLIVYAEYRCRSYLGVHYPDKKFLKTFPDDKFKEVVEYIASGRSLLHLKFILWDIIDKEGHKQWRRDYAKEYYKRPKNKKRNWFNQIKNRATKKGIEFDLVIEDISVSEYCPLLNIKLEFGGKRDTSPSIGRIDPSKGYTADNVWVISYRANRIKNDATFDELATLVGNLKKELLFREHIEKSEQ